MLTRTNVGATNSAQVYRITIVQLEQYLLIKVLWELSMLILIIWEKTLRGIRKSL